MAGVSDLVVASATIRGGRLIVRNRRAFDEQIRQFKEGLELEVSVSRKRATRSAVANAYYWGVVLHALSLHTGYTADELHDICKAQFLPKRLALNNGNGEVVGEFVLGGSTRTLNTNEFYEYVECVRQWASETLDCYTPDPGEDGYGI